jgi:hypothetical protein
MRQSRGRLESVLQVVRSGGAGGSRRRARIDAIASGSADSGHAPASDDPRASRQARGRRLLRLGKAGVSRSWFRAIENRPIRASSVMIERRSLTHEGENVAVRGVGWGHSRGSGPWDSRFSGSRVRQGCRHLGTGAPGRGICRPRRRRDDHRGQGYVGGEFAAGVQALHATILRPRRKDEPGAGSRVSRSSQVQKMLSMR